MVNMTMAFVLINCEAGAEEKLIKNIAEVNEVTEIQSTIGSYDLLVKVVSPTPSELRKIISERILSQDKVHGTQVLLKSSEIVDLR